MAVLFLNDQRVGGIDTGLTHLSSVGLGVVIVENWEDLWLAKKGNIYKKMSKTRHFCVLFNRAQLF